MVFDIDEVSGIGDFERRENVYSVGEKAFLVVNEKTVEVRTDANLAKLLQEKYESVMRSRYFGRGGIEIAMTGQLSEAEICDLVRLSYNLTAAAGV